MDLKRLILGLAFGGVLFSGCNDELSQVGPSIQPGGDRSFVYADTFQVEASTIKLDSVYARTVNGLLGQIYDPLYGNLKTDYICQFYCPEDYKFAHEPIDGKVDSMAFFIMYNNGGYVGDSLAPMQAKIYKVTKPLDRNYYTNMDPAEYCDLQTLIGEKTYTAYDLSISDSIRKITDTSDPNYYTPNVRIRINTDVAQSFYDETINNPNSFHNQEAFNNFFPGFYVTTGFGTGNILEVAQSSFFIYYKYMSKTSAGNDTIIHTREQFNVTKEVIQMNQVENGNIEQLLQPNDEYAYIKSPAGVCTKVIVPTSVISEKIEGRIINGLNFSVKAMPQEEWLYAFEAPEYVLLLPEDSVQSFFLNNKIEDSVTAYLASYTSSSKTYSFGNISNLLKKHVESKPNEDLRLLIIPVARGTQNSNNYYGESKPVTTSITNYMKPAGVRLKKDKESMQMVVLTSKYND